MAESQNLCEVFILEIFVENLNVNYEYYNLCREKQPISIAVKFKPIPCFELVRKNGHWPEKEENAPTTRIPWKEGRSCVFSQDPLTLAEYVKNYPVLLILKGIDELEASVIGKTKVSLRESMAGTNFPKIKGEDITLQDNFDLYNEKNEVIGFLSLMIRLTCMGTEVFTEIETKEVSHQLNYCFKEVEKPYETCKACEARKTTQDKKSCEKILIEGPEEPKDVAPMSPEDKIMKCSKASSPSCLSLSLLSTPVRQHLIKDKRILKQPANLETKLIKSVKKHSSKLVPRKRIKYVSGPIIRNRTQAGHKNCKSSQQPVPRRHGWAWSIVEPEGLQGSDGWKPGYFQKDYLKSLKRKPVQRPSKTALDKNNFPQIQVTKRQVPTLKVVKKDGLCKVIIQPEGVQPKIYEFPISSDESDLEVDAVLPFTKANRKGLAQVRHQAQQFCDSDFDFKEITPSKLKKTTPISKIKREAYKRDKSKERKRKKQKMRQEKKVKINPWDDWIMKLECKKPKIRFEEPEEKNSGRRGRSPSQRQQKKLTTIPSARKPSHKIEKPRTHLPRSAKSADNA